MQTIIAACLLLATKVEEVLLSLIWEAICTQAAKPCNKKQLQAPVKSVDLFNALKSCQSVMEKGTPMAASSSGGAADVIVGSEYAAVKRQVHLSEQILLRQISFNLAVKHPHRYLLNFGKSCGLGRAAMQLAVFLANDSLVYTDLCLLVTASELAAACLRIAVCLLKTDDPLGGDYSALGLSQEQVAVASSALLQMMQDVGAGA